MRLNRSGNTKRNIIVGEIDRISGILLPFIVRTMILHMIGAEYLGLTSLFYSILQMLNLMEMGFGSAIVFSMYQPIAADDSTAVNALLGFYRKVYRRTGHAVSALGLLIMCFLPRLIHGETPPDINIYRLYLIYLVNAVITLYIFPERKALLAAHQRDDVSLGIHAVTQLAMYLLQAGAVVLSRNYYLYAAVMPLTSVIYSLFCARAAGKLYPQYRGGGELPLKQYEEIRRQVYGLVIRKLAMLSRNAFDSMFVSAFLGLSITAVYANYYYIMDSVVMVVAVIKTSMAGGVGNSIAMETKEKNLKDMEKINFLFMWISAWCAVCLLCLYQPFMRLWVGEQMMFGFRMAVLFAVYFYVLKMSDIRTLYSEAAGLWWQGRYISVLEAGANLLLNWLLIRSMGITGIVTATLISYFVFNFAGGAWVLFRHYFTEGGLKTYFSRHFLYAATAFLAGAVTFYAAHNTGRGTAMCLAILGEKAEVCYLGELLISGIICLILPNLVWLFFWHRSEQFKTAVQLLKRLRKRN